MAKVSIVMPVFNCVKYLTTSLDSVFTQTCQDFELICVDDGSTDGSCDILRRYQAEHAQNMKVIYCEHKGPGIARNIALGIAAGEYLMFLDADDFYDNTLIEKAVKQADRTQSDVVIWDLWIYSETYQRNQYPEMGTLNFQNFDTADGVFSFERNPDQIFLSFQNWPWNKMFRRSFVAENHIEFQEISRTEDLLFTCMALVSARRISLINERLSYYRVGRVDSAMSWKDNHPLDFLTAFGALKKRLEKKGVYEQVKRSFVNWALCSCVYNLETLKTYDAYFEVYRTLRDSGFKNLDIVECADEDYVVVDEWYRNYYSIMSIRPEQYLLDRCSGLARQVDRQRGIIDKIGAEFHEESKKKNQQVADLCIELDALQQEHDAVLRAIEQRVGQAICRIPRAIQRRIYK
ncbi:MAG: glycosyltransferase family 2 protein [Gordonibacter sp.]|nr:glycosyltransferase family 2 protein [Gordonibacter sp.]